MMPTIDKLSSARLSRLTSFNWLLCAHLVRSGTSLNLLDGANEQHSLTPASK